MNKVRKIFIISILISLTIYSSVFAIDDIFTDADSWENDGETATLVDGTTVDTIDDTVMKDLSSTIYNIAFGIGVIVVFVVGAFLGLKFITTGVAEKAEVKEALVPYAISSVVFFGAFGVWKLAVLLLGSLV